MFTSLLFGNAMVRACPSRRPLAPLPVRRANTAEESARARRHWKALTKRISRLLRLRKRWAALGQFLQLPRVQNIFFGLDRQRGQLVRRMAAPLNNEQ